jgi:hypothetical protein
MGCQTITQESDEKRLKLRDEIVRLVTENPFYNVNIKDFRKFMKQFKGKEISVESEMNEDEPKITKEYIMEKMIEKYLEKSEDAVIYIFTSVVNFSFERFSKVFRGNEFDEEIIPIIFDIIFIFLTQRQKGIKKEMRTDLCILFERIKLKVDVEDNSEKIAFNTGKFSFLILNLIQLCSFCFLSFFCGPATLSILENYNAKVLEVVFSDDEDKSDSYKPEKINKIVNQQLKEINTIIRPEIINSLILTQTLQPISDYINENKDEEQFKIDTLKLIDIFDLLIDKMDYENYIDLFFNTGDEK